MAHQLPIECRGERVDAEGTPFDENYVNFHRVYRKPVKGAKKWADRALNLWYVKPVKITGHSRTNMAYGVTEKCSVHQREYTPVYWGEDGKCYIGRIWK